MAVLHSVDTRDQSKLISEKIRGFKNLHEAR